MNASFRTAFWAMCLGLTVPMMLFVGVELTSGGRSPAFRKGGPVSAASSLQAQWSASPAPATAANGTKRKTTKGTRSANRPVDPRTQAARIPGAPQSEFRGARLGLNLDTDLDPDLPMNGADPAPWNGGAASEPFADLLDSQENIVGGRASVMLDRELEPDPADVDERPESSPRPQAIPTANRIRPGYPAGYPTDQSLPGYPSPTSRIESQLDAILGYLRRISESSSARSPLSSSTGDPMLQATELLIRLQQARRIQDLAEKVPEISSPAVPPAAGGAAAPTLQLLPPAPKAIEQLPPTDKATQPPAQSTPSLAPQILPQSSARPQSGPQFAASRPRSASSAARAEATRHNATRGMQSSAGTRSGGQQPLVRPRSQAAVAATTPAAPPRTVKHPEATPVPLMPRVAKRRTRKGPPAPTPLKGKDAIVDGCDVPDEFPMNHSLAVALAPEKAEAFPVRQTQAFRRETGDSPAGVSPFTSRLAPAQSE